MKIEIHDLDKVTIDGVEFVPNVSVITGGIAQKKAVEHILRFLIEQPEFAYSDSTEIMLALKALSPNLHAMTCKHGPDDAHYAFVTT